MIRHTFPALAGKRNLSVISHTKNSPPCPIFLVSPCYYSIISDSDYKISAGNYIISASDYIITTDN